MIAKPRFTVIFSSSFIWKTVQSPLPVAFLVTMCVTKRFKSINHMTSNTHNQCSWWDLGDKAIFERLSLSFELATKLEGVLRLLLEARVFFILSQWVPAHDLGIGLLHPFSCFRLLGSSHPMKSKISATLLCSSRALPGCRSCQSCLQSFVWEVCEGTYALTVLK